MKTNWNGKNEKGLVLKKIKEKIDNWFPSVWGGGSINQDVYWNCYLDW